MKAGLSYLSQMLVIIFMMFVSAASGYAACIAFIRGLAGRTSDQVGNFYSDLVRIITRVLLPFSILTGLLLVWQGVPQNSPEQYRGGYSGGRTPDHCHRSGSGAGEHQAPRHQWRRLPGS